MGGPRTRLTLKDGREVTILGRWSSLVERLTEKSLTGSAVALDDQLIGTVEGGTVRFGDVASSELVDPQ